MPRRCASALPTYIKKWESPYKLCGETNLITGALLAKFTCKINY